MDKFPPRYWVFCEVERLWLLSKSALIPALSCHRRRVGSYQLRGLRGDLRGHQLAADLAAVLDILRHAVARRVAAVSTLERALAVAATSTLQPELWLVCSLTYQVDSTFLARMRRASSAPAFPFAAPPYRFRLMSAPPISRTLPTSTEPPPKLRFALR